MHRSRKLRARWAFHLASQIEGPRIARIHLGMMDVQSRRYVRQRAGNRCEYCLMKQEFDELVFQIEHIIPRKHHGSDATDNLALACFSCNNHKGPNLTGL